jgi:hypothetical protein
MAHTAEDVLRRRLPSLLTDRVAPEDLAAAEAFMSSLPTSLDRRV